MSSKQNDEVSDLPTGRQAQRTMIRVNVAGKKNMVITYLFNPISTETVNMC